MIDIIQKHIQPLGKKSLKGACYWKPQQHDPLVFSYISYNFPRSTN